jgi:tryptophan synthase beta chain
VTWFGEFGGQFVPETLIPALEELENAWAEVREDGTFAADLRSLLTDYVGARSSAASACG